MTRKHPRRPRLLARIVVRRAFRVYRQHPFAIAAIAAVVFAPVALIDTFASTEAFDLVARGGGEAVVGVVVLLGTAVLTAGSAVGAGVMHRLVAVHYGGPRLTMREGLRSLPKGRILGVDLAVSAIVTVGSVLGALPGLAAYTLLCLAGALLVDEDLGVREAMRRSVDMTRHNLVVTILIVTIPVVVEHQVLDALEVFWDFPFWVLFAAHLVTSIVVLAPVVLVEIVLALTLGDRQEVRYGAAQPVSV
jgi:hypothetical protein